MALDQSFVREQFPAFSEASLSGFSHFENAGGSYACRQVIDRLDRFYRQTKVQPYYEFAPSEEAGALMDSARSRLAAWLNVDTSELHFGPSTSQNTYVLAQAMRQMLKPGDEVIVTNQDHEANIGAWSRLEDSGIKVREWKIDPDTAELHPVDLEALLTGHTRMVAFTHCSNVIATVNPVREITDMIHEAGALAVVDGVSFVPHGLPDIQALGADVYLFSLYKVYGPHLGAMYIRNALNAQLPFQGHFFNAKKPGARFTPAGPDHGQIAAVNGVVDYMEAVHDHHADPAASTADKAATVRALLHEQETSLLQPLLDFLGNHPSVRLLGQKKAKSRAPTVAFDVNGKSVAAIASALGKKGLGVGVGNFYAYRLMEALGIKPDEGVLRVSYVHYTLAEEIERLVQALDELLD